MNLHSMLEKINDSQSFIAENCSSPVSALSATASEKQAVSTATASGKESASTEENGSGKESPHCEDGYLPERYTSNGTLCIQIQIRTNPRIENMIFCLDLSSISI